MRTTIDINDKLYEDAKKLTGIRTKKELINASLKEMIRRKRIEHLVSLYGKSAIDLTMEDIEKFREDESKAS